MIFYEQNEKHDFTILKECYKNNKITTFCYISNALMISCTFEGVMPTLLLMNCILQSVRKKKKEHPLLILT